MVPHPANAHIIQILHVALFSSSIYDGTYAFLGVGIELVDGDKQGWFGSIGGAVKACGGVNSILHQSGVAKWQIHTQHLHNAALTKYLPITVSAGAPMMMSPLAAVAPPVSAQAIRQSLVCSAAILTDCLCFQVVAAATTLTLPHGASIVHISGTTHITSVEADPGHMLRPVTLVFLESLVVIAGKNLRLAGDFTTIAGAGAALTMACDGTNWYETGRNTK